MWHHLFNKHTYMTHPSGVHMTLCWRRGSRYLSHLYYQLPGSDVWVEAESVDQVVDQFPVEGS